MGGRKWRGRSGEHGGGEINREGVFGGGFELVLKSILGVGGAGVYFGVFGEPVGGEWLLFWLLVFA